MKIKSEFLINGQTVKVIFDDEKMHKEGALGLCYSDQNKIYLSRTTIDDGKKIKLPADKIQSVYIHEVVHYILHTMGEVELSANEKFVETFSSLLHQFLNSK